MPLPANGNRKRKRTGTITLNHSVLFRKTAPRMAPGTEPRPPTTTIVSARMLSTGAKICSPSACWCSTSRPPANDAKNPESANASSFTRVGLRRNACAARSLSRVATRSRTFRDRCSPRTASNARIRPGGARRSSSGARSSIARCAERRPQRDAVDAVDEIVGQERRELVAVEQERRRRHRERERGHREHEPADSQRREADDHRRHRADRAREQEAEDRRRGASARWRRRPRRSRWRRRRPGRG